MTEPTLTVKKNRIKTYDFSFQNCNFRRGAFFPLQPVVTGVAYTGNWGRKLHVRPSPRTDTCRRNIRTHTHTHVAN